MSTRMLSAGGCLLISCLLASLGAARSQSEEPCTNPFGQAGFCITLKTCPSVMRYLRSLSRPWPPSTRVVLLSLQCGFEGMDPKVCCPPVFVPEPPRTTTAAPDPVTVTPTATTAGPGSGDRSPPFVENHPNLGLLPRTCGTLEDDRLFGGNKTGLYEFPWMSLISYNTVLSNSGGSNAESITTDKLGSGAVPNILSERREWTARGLRFSCGSTIINSRYILTAAHCVTNLGTATLAGVRVGEHDISKEIDCEGPARMRSCSPGVQDFTIAQAIPHPSYIGVRDGRLPQLQNDIALIRINGEIDFSKDNALPICLPTTRILQEMNLDGVNTLVAGWGATEDGPSSPDLLKVTLPVVSNEVCGGIHNRSTADGISFRQLCAGGIMGVDSCGGDSGGPLMIPGPVGDSVSFVQYGIVSYGPKRCGSAGVPGVYTRVAHYMDWILDQLKP